MRTTAAVRRSTRVRRASPFVALLALLVGLLVAAEPASAASEAAYLGLGHHAQVWGQIGDDYAWGYPAGEMLMAIDGGDTVIGYCIDIHTRISVEDGGNLPEVPWATSGIANLDKVSYVLHTYQPGSDLLVGTDDEKAAAIQAAIWHLTDGFVLDTEDHNAPDVIASYATILASIPAEGLPPEPPPSLAITPPSDSALVGGVAGPFTVATTASDVPLTVPAGVQVVDWATRLPITTVSDGDQLGIRSGSVGTVEVTASATATVHAGRVFARLDEAGNPVVQRLILAQQSPATASASVTATFRQQSTTTTTQPTTTTTQPTTTTTAPTTTTTAPAVTTTTVAPTTTTVQVAGEVIRRDLPRTGQPVRSALGYGVAALFLGVVALGARRRWVVLHHTS